MYSVHYTSFIDKIKTGFRKITETAIGRICIGIEYIPLQNVQYTYIIEYNVYHRQ